MTHLKKNLLRTMAAAAAVILCLAGLCLPELPGIRSAAAEEQEIVSSYPYTTVTRDKVNLRKSRSTKSTLIQRIPAGAGITVKSKNGSWVEVEYGKYKGWVLAEYVVLKTVKKIRVTPTPTPIPTLSPQEDAGGYNILKRGAIGMDVRSLQEALIELGFLTGTADGTFGTETEKAVIAFQRKNQYPDTGLVDANLQAFLYSGRPLNSKGAATQIRTLSPVPGVTMKLNNTGALVGELQQRLKDLGYYKNNITNKYDTNTKNAVLAFQKKNGIKADGWAGAETRSLLAGSNAIGANEDPTPTPTPVPTPTAVPEFDVPETVVQSGSKGEDAGTVQSRLKILGYYKGEIDGNFGRASVNALKNFQQNNGLKADGIAGKGTYEKLFNASAVPYTVKEETPTPAPAATPTAVPASSAWTTLREGMKGTDIRQLQENLIRLGYLSGKADGSYGEKTTAAVKEFQRNNGLAADGAAGEKTLKVLYGGNAKEAKATATPKADSAKTAATPTPSTMRRGSTGTAVKDLQSRLIALGYLTGRADGVYGSKTASAVKAFQKANKLTADGIAGVKTLAKLASAGANPSSSATATPAVTATPAPTAVPGGTEALIGRPNASRVIYANWYTTVKAVCRKYPYATVYDYATGISWQVHIFSLGAHADFEPVTANDTLKMRRAFGNETTWNPKPVWVIFSDGSVYMGSTHDTPHGVSHNGDNNFTGHACLHFPRTQEQVTAIGPYATSHQEAIDKGWAATRQMAK